MSHMFNGVAMCCQDVVLTCYGTRCWILSCCLNVQWCGHVLWRCDVTWVRCWILSCCLNVQWCGHVLWRCDVRVMGTVLDFELLSQCSMVWPCVVEM